VGFDPNAYRYLSPKAALRQSKVDNVQLAGVEVLMATLLFPAWATSWNGTSSPYPIVSGLQLHWNALWSYVLCLVIQVYDRELTLGGFCADDVGVLFTLPSVRECKN
jgi:hypothetical protein